MLNIELMKGIQQLEAKYGSVADAPNTDKTLIYLRRKFGSGFQMADRGKKKAENKKKAKFLTVAQRSKIKPLIQQGYTANEIKNKLGGTFTIAQIKGVAAMFDIPLKPSFKYCLIIRKTKKPVIYSNSFKKICQYIQFPIPENAYLKREAPKIERLTDYKLIQGSFRWCDIPDRTVICYQNAKRHQVFTRKFGDHY